MTRIVDVTREDLLRRRQTILDVHRTTLDVFMARANQYALVGTEWEALDELEKIAFLLGDDDLA